MNKLVILLFVAMSLCVNSQAQHSLVLKSGEKMNGNVKTLKDGVVEFLYKGNIMKLNVSDIYSINFVEAQAGKAVSGLESSAALPKEVGEKQITAGSYMVRYKVADRIISKAPKIDNLTQDKGTVVVNISIDKYGHVMKAVPDGAGSTTDSEYLRTKAKQAAESAIFNSVPTAPLEQKGYMVIVF